MKLLFLSAHTPTYKWHRWELLESIAGMGHEVVAVGPGEEPEWTDRFKNISVRYRQVHISRTGMNPFVDYRSCIEIKMLLKEELPDKMFVYMSKAIVLGAYAAHSVGIREVYALVGGLGSIIRGEGIMNTVLKRPLKALYRRSFKICRLVFFHNHDDANVLIDEGILPETKSRVVNGSGVNLKKFRPEPFPDQFTFLFAGRLIKDKGIHEYLEACRQIKAEYPLIRCLVVGRRDTKADRIDFRIVKKHVDDKIVEYYDEQDDIRPFIAQSSVVVLPSYHEGRPKILLEAMAMGRPMITTDAPGCRDTVTENINGLMVRPKDSNDLADKMKELIADPRKLNTLGNAGKKIAKKDYNVHNINKKFISAMSISDN